MESTDNTTLSSKVFFNNRILKDKDDEGNTMLLGGERFPL